MQPTLLASLSGFGLVGMVFVGAANKRNRRHMMVLAMILVVMMICMVGCGGGGSSSSNNNNNSGTPGTPAGSYSLTVTATGNGAPAQTMGVTLVVQ
jgi:hypothetical protein